MDYKELSAAVKLCGSMPKIDQCRQCLYWAGGDMSKCIQRMTADAATAITDLLSRAEAAERQRDAAIADLKHKDNCEICVGCEIAPKECSCEWLECTLDCRCKICRNEDKREWRGLKEE